MKTYYVIVGLACLAAVMYVLNTGTREPWWVAFLLGYAAGTPLGTALAMFLRERWDR